MRHRERSGLRFLYLAAFWLAVGVIYWWVT